MAAQRGSRNDRLKAFAVTGMTAFPKNEQPPEVATAKMRSEIKRWGDVSRANKIEAAQ